LLAGVIGISPLILSPLPTPKLLRIVGAALAAIVPWLQFPVEIPLEYLSHDPAVYKPTEVDPLWRGHGTARGVVDMLNMGERHLYDSYRNWPQKLPVLIFHGTHDKVTSHKASEEL